jgi:hypothetical protein
MPGYGATLMHETVISMAVYEYLPVFTRIYRNISPLRIADCSREVGEDKTPEQLQASGDAQLLRAVEPLEKQDVSSQSPALRLTPDDR